MTGRKTEEAVSMEEQTKTWTCECGTANEMTSYQLNMGGKAKCKSKKCDVITIL